MKKRSLFERLSGGGSDDFDSFDDEPRMPVRKQVAAAPASAAPSEEAADGQLPVDVYQTPNEIVIRTFIAGVRADEMNVSISRDMVVIEGSREEHEQVQDSDYFVRELFWGSFARTILLPEEIDVDASTAAAKDGYLTITMPKLDKKRQTKLRVRSA
jgi:HSP20 family protein